MSNGHATGLKNESIPDKPGEVDRKVISEGLTGLLKQDEGKVVEDAKVLGDNEGKVPTFRNT